MAANKACRIFELVEMIILELPFNDLITLTGVNKTFQACINSNSKIQEKLFLKQTSNNESVEPTLNPTIEHIIRRTHAAWNKAPLMKCELIRTSKHNVIHVFPLKSKAKPCARVELEMRYEKRDGVQQHYYLNIRIELTFDENFTLPPGKSEMGGDESWREMYLTDRMCDVYTSIKMNMSSSSGERKLDLPRTAKMADLIDGVDFLVRQRAEYIHGVGWI